MAEQIEQLMRQVKLGGMAKGWRSVPYENTEQYVTDLLTLELQERETNRINRMVKTAGFPSNFFTRSNSSFNAGSDTLACAWEEERSSRIFAAFSLTGSASCLRST